jgi:transposase
MLALCQKMTIQDATELLHVSWDLVKDHHKDHLRKIYRKRDWKRLKYLGIDEFSVKKGHKYLTIAVDLEVGDIIFANEGKSKETLIPLLLKLKRFSQSLQAIAIDMSPAFIEAIMEYLPHEISQFANSAYPWNLKLLRP